MRTRMSVAWLRTVAVLTVSMTTVSPAQDGSQCGGFIKVSKYPLGNLSSPNYPAPYNAYSKCIWLLETDRYSNISITIERVNGESSAGQGCLDYLEVRAGSSTADLLYYGCDQNESVTLTAPSRWLWMHFKSDETVNNGGFRAQWFTNDSGVQNNENHPFPSCNRQQFRCANKECISWAGLCDGFPDCGCQDGCDEDLDRCGPTAFTTNEKLGIGIGVGTGVFALVLILVGTYEWHLMKQKGRKWENTRVPKPTKTVKKNTDAHRRLGVADIWKDDKPEIDDRDPRKSISSAISVSN